MRPAHRVADRGAAGAGPGRAAAHDRSGAHDGHDGGGHGGDHAPAHARAFRERFVVCAVLTLPLAALSDPIRGWLGLSAGGGLAGATTLLGAGVFAYGGAPFLRGARRELEARRPGMMTLVALALLVAFGWSVATLAGVSGMAMWLELATLVDVMLLGHWIEMRSVARAGSALRELAALLPETAERLLPGDRKEVVPIDALSEGERVLVRPGGRVPADGVVVEGRAAVDESMITGESIPVSRGEGDPVLGGTLNGEGALVVRVTATGERTALAHIGRLVAQAQRSRSRAQDLADRAALALTAAALVTAGAALAAWLLSGAGALFAVRRAVTVLVIACPHALGLAVPLVIAISTSLAARSGVIVKDRLAFERARRIDVVVFDKTGTLTRGEHRVTAVHVAPGVEPGRALALASSVEARSEHFFARALVAEAGRRGLTLERVASFEALPGRGVRGMVGDTPVAVGGPGLLAQLGAGLPAPLEASVKASSARGESLAFLVERGEVKAAFAFADVVRDEAREAVDRLRARGVRVAMVTGDREEVAHDVAVRLGIDEVRAGVLPAEKAEFVRHLREAGLRVAMVGDGVNDAPALLEADLGVAIGAGTAVAVEAGSIVLVRDDPRDVDALLELSERTHKKVRENLLWATGYNVVALPLAAGLAAPLGVLLPPALGALLMAASTVIVALNAQLVRRAPRAGSKGAPPPPRGVMRRFRHAPRQV